MGNGLKYCDFNPIDIVHQPLKVTRVSENKAAGKHAKIISRRRTQGFNSTDGISGTEPLHCEAGNVNVQIARNGDQAGF